MSFSPLKFLKKAFVFFWSSLDAGRRAFMNLLFLGLIVVVLIAIFTRSKPLNEKTVLVLDLKGRLVEQYSGTVREMVLAGAQGNAKKETRLRDILVALDTAAADPKISSVLLLTDDMNGAGLATLREVGSALDHFKRSGKQVWAWGSSFDQRQYYLASHANQVWMNPMGMVMLEGFGRYRNYYRDALDKLGVTVNLMRVGTYKSFGESYVANGPSKAALEADSFLYNALWSTYTGDVEQARKLPAGAIMDGIDNLPQRLQAANGDIARLALDSKLVDQLRTRDEMRNMLVRQGVFDASNKTFRQVSLPDYLALQAPKLLGKAVGVIVASGEISDGIAAGGAIGGRSTANLIRQARDDDNVKAVVLRVDSPGGSVFGSELIRHELELTRRAGKPVVVSMGDVAASGGYWISMAADEVIADKATVTGSIGVFALLPRADKVIDKLGIHTGGVATTWLGDVTNPLRPLDPRFGQLIQTSIDHIYADFTSKAAAARKTTPAAIDAVAQGRVWTGQQARERGLIDTLGSYDYALKSAAARAHLGSDYRIAYFERTGSRFDAVFDFLGASINGVLAQHFNIALLPTGLPPAPARDVAQDLSWLMEMSDGSKTFMPLAHCLCKPM